MQFFKRVKDIVSSNVNSALDKFEDPQKMIALMVTNLEELQTKTRSSIAGKKAELIALNHRVKEAQDAVNRWAERAKLAVANGKEDLARGLWWRNGKLRSITIGLSTRSPTWKESCSSKYPARPNRRQAEGSEG